MTGTQQRVSAPKTDGRGSTIKGLGSFKIPPYVDKDNLIYAIVESVGPTGYSIQLAWAKDYNGGNWCHFGDITGSASQNDSQVTDLREHSALV